ncbi:response regulator [Pseudobacteroides cellulosolvens]|uniref:Stage 0 sporulation protein A homolog n=1 Tax=Pseudobacteroides cellulosolvens ATCC 35603 = DSM 2933 TaxID=398512 RepID=A0A0L6JWL4_9FIRM|nr:response regulator [Pseudobacteroides cellulosolvens]KNY30228.1 two component transcriptional regulator, AraC family [Pseudobacteroides cellulosolvens ATCC 35603 = DSM 2933]
MYKMIIADDEAFVRDTFKMVVNKHFPQVRVVAEAETGREAIEMASEFNPNLMIMDVKMPGINGLQAIYEIKKINSETRFIVLTAYDHFKYAREALSLSVDEYILKPARREKIIEAVSKVLKTIEELRSKKDQELELKEKLSNVLPAMESEFALSMIFGDTERINQMNYPKLLGRTFEAGYSMVLDFNIHDSKNKDIIKGLLNSKVRDFLTMFFNARVSYCIISPVFSNRVAVFFPEDMAYDIDEIGAISIDLARSLVKKIQEEFGTSPFIGVGGIHKGIDGLIESYNEANLAVSSKKQAVSCVDDIEYIKVDASYSFKLERQLCEKVRQFDKDEAIETFKELYFSINPWETQNITNKMCELMVVLARILLDFDMESTANKFFDDMEKKHLMMFDSKQEICEWCISKILQLVNYLADSKSINTEDDIIISAARFIEANYMHEITLEDVAKAVNVSPYYLSKLFKSQMSQNFIDFLTDLRVDAAKKKIPDSNMSIKEICYEVGYNDPNYFTRVFKKVTGQTPLEYRQANKSAGNEGK